MDNITEKIKEISSKFDVAEQVLQESELIEDISKDVINHKDEYHPSDVMSLEIMAEDFKFNRNSLRESITYGKKVLERVAQDLLLDDKGKATDTQAFAELTSAVLNGTKVLSQMYKDFSTVLLNIKKINESQTPQNVTNNLTINEPISTVDLIEKLRNS